MALNPVWANELWIGTEYSSSSWSYAKLCKGIESMSFTPNEQNQQYFFICGEGFAHNEVTGAAPSITVSGRRIAEPTEPGIYIMNGKKVIVK